MFTFTLDDHNHDHGHSHDHDHNDDHNETDEESIPVLKDMARLDNCVTVIDACNFDSTFHTSDFLSDRFDADENDVRTVVHLMIDQIEFANIIVLNKINMVKQADLERIIKTIKKLNPGAEIYPTNYSKVPLTKLLNTYKFNFQAGVRNKTSQR